MADLLRDRFLGFKCTRYASGFDSPVCRSVLLLLLLLLKLLILVRTGAFVVEFACVDVPADGVVEVEFTKG